MIQRIASNNQPNRPPRLAFVAVIKAVEELGFPDYRAFFPILDVIRPPLLLREHRRMSNQIIYPACGKAAMHALAPSAETAWHFPHMQLAAFVEPFVEFGDAAIPFIVSHPRQMNTIVLGPIQQFQGDFPLGTIKHLRGNARFFTAITICRPIFREKQLAIQKHSKTTRSEKTKMNRDNAVVLLAAGPAVLAFNSRRLITFLHVTGFINDS